MNSGQTHEEILVPMQGERDVMNMREKKGKPFYRPV